MSARAMARGVTRRGRAAAARDTAATLFPANDYVQRGYRTSAPHRRNDPIPDDRTALRRIVDEADIISVRGQEWLLVACPPPLLDYLATFEAVTADDEDSGDDEPDHDDERDGPPTLN